MSSFMIMFRRIKGMRGRKMDRWGCERDKRVLRVWRSIWNWYRRSVSFGKDFVEVLCDRFPFQQSGSRCLMVVGQNDTQCFLHENVPQFLLHWRYKVVCYR